VSYWDEIDRRVTEAEAGDDGDRPDPWADRGDDGAAALTPDQREFLEALADQPAVPNLARELAGEPPPDGHGPGPEPDPDGTGDPTG
jgi:hypothetical protein